MIGKVCLDENAITFLALRKACKVKVTFKGKVNIIDRYILIVLKIAIVW